MQEKIKIGLQTKVTIFTTMKGLLNSRTRRETFFSDFSFPSSSADSNSATGGLGLGQRGCSLIDKIVKSILLLLCFASMAKCDDLLTFRFDKEVTWKQIFDFGFRPKYLFPRNTCQCLNQSFLFQFEDRIPKFKLDKGTLQFMMPIGEEVHMVWHQGNEAITLKEGRRRADEFRSVFDGYIVQEIIVPRPIDSSGLVDAGNDDNNVKARVGKYLILYGFDNSLQKLKPLIPHFYIALNYPGKPDYRVKPTSYKINSPVGYEWYSLDPAVDTPDPELNLKKEVTTSVEVGEKSTTFRKQRSPAPMERPKVSNSVENWVLWAVLIALTFICGFFLKRHFLPRSE